MHKENKVKGSQKKKKERRTKIVHELVFVKIM
jgi:hypothetical protein